MSPLAICLGLFAVIGLTSANWNLGGSAGGIWGRRHPGGGWNNRWGGQQSTTEVATRATCRSVRDGTTLEVDIRPVASMSMWQQQSSLQLDLKITPKNGDAARTLKAVLTELGSVGNTDGCDNENLGRILQTNNRRTRQPWGMHGGWGAMSTMTTMSTMGVLGEVSLDNMGNTEDLTVMNLPRSQLKDLWGAGFALCEDTEAIATTMTMGHWGWGQQQQQTQYQCKGAIPFCCTLARADSAPN